MTALEGRLQEALGPSYRLGRELGGGGMSRVFVADEVELGRQVVVKVLPPDMAAGLNAERFRREIQLAASLQHPHIVPLIAAGRSGDLVWYTMPLINGESLRARLARERELPVPDTVRILRDVADALAHAHSQGVVHRDIKPDNVLMSGRHAVVTDFGVAKALSASTGESSLTSIGVALGTPAYMAPEQASADPNVDHRADLYAFGVMAYEMLTGRPPFEGQPQAVLAAHVTQTPDLVSQRRLSVPPTLAALVMRCLEKKPADRFQSAAELHEQLELMATPSGGAAPTRAVPPTTSAVPRGVRSRWAIPAVLGAVFLAAIILWKPWTRGTGENALNPQVVAILPFRVAGADPSLHYLRQGMLDLLQAKLTGEGGPRAADARSVLAAFREAGGGDTNDVPDNALMHIAQRVGAGRVLQGSIVGPPNHIVISATVLEMPGARTVAQTAVEGPKDSLFTLVDRLTAQVLALEAGATTQQLAALTTPNLDALRAYLDGQAAYRRGGFDKAVEHLERAVALDSTFALALSVLVEAIGWTRSPPDRQRYERLAWQYRDRLNPRDQLLLSIRLGSRFPDATPSTEALADRERAVQVMPESPDVWYLLGDELFHFGPIADVGDHLERARTAFERAVSLDSAFSAPVTHLATLAYLRRDTVEARRWWSRAMALDTSGFGARVARTEMSLLTGDTALMWQLLRAAPTSNEGPLRLLWLYPLDPTVVREHRRMLELARSRVATGDALADVQYARLFTLYNAGRPVEARALNHEMMAHESLGRDPAGILLWARMFWGSDTVGTGAALRQISERPRFTDLFLTGLWSAFHGDLRSAEAVAARLRNDPSLLDTSVVHPVRYPLLLEAWIAAVRNAPDARARAISAYTAWRGWRQGAELATALAVVLDRVGEPQRALAALRRRYHTLASPPLDGLVSDRLIEARLAARLGDREAATRAYRACLLWRADPEPPLIPQRDSARAELARLEQR